MSTSCAVTQPQLLLLETTGSFTVERANHELNRCGPAGSPRTLAYKVVIQSCPAFLDEQGFIIDWQAIRDYFTETYRELDVFPSCERIACRACTDIVAMLGGKCLALEITIGSGSRPAGMTARWTCSEEHYRNSAQGAFGDLPDFK